MNIKMTAALLLTSATLVSGLAHAQTTPLTREQVKAELYEAMRTGNMEADPVSHRLLKDVYPGQYPRKDMVALKTNTNVAQKTMAPQNVN